MRPKTVTIAGIIAAALLCGMIASTLSTSAGGEGGDVLDQEWTGEGQGWTNLTIGSAEPMGMTFISTAPTLAGVDLWMSTHTGEHSATITVDVRESSINGPIAGSTSRVVDSTVHGWTRFAFHPAVEVKPGATYVLEVESSNDAHYLMATFSTLSHPGYSFGNAISQGDPWPGDVIFRSYSFVGSSGDPTPSPGPLGPGDLPIRASIDRTEPGGEVTILIYADHVPAPGIGAWNIDVSYDDGLVSETRCEAVIGICGPRFDENTSRLVGGSQTGYSGDLVFARETYQAGDEEGVAVIELSINQLTTPSGEDIGAQAVDGSITIARILPFGDVLCDGAVDPADALAILRSQTSLSAIPQDEPCVNIGEDRLGHTVGDLDCDGDIDSVDALAALRASTNLPPIAQDEPCPNVGSPL